MAANHLTPEEVRHFIWDRTVADNMLEMDLSFSDPEITQAMRFCCMSFNDIQPYVYRIDPECMSDTAYLIHGVIYHLYLAKLSQLMRNDVDYQGGNMTVKLNQIEYLKGQLDFHKQEFETKAKEHKLAANIASGFRCFR